MEDSKLKLETKGDLYKLILGEARDVKPRTDEELSSLIKACCAEFNRANGLVVDAELMNKVSDDMMVNYFVNFRLFLMSVGMLPGEYKGDVVQSIIHRHDPDCECLLSVLFWFWNVAEKAEQFIIGRMR